MNATGATLDNGDGLGSLLSAFLDGELTDDERRQVEDALTDDADLRTELDAVAHTRNLVRDLPLLEIPEDLAARLVARSPLGPVGPPRRRPRSRAFAMSALASIAFWGLVATSGGTTAIVPDLAGVVGAHLRAVGEEVHPEADPSLMFTAPGAFDDFELVYASRRGNVAHAMYTDGTTEISVFEEPGRIDWTRVPTSGDVVDVGGASAWTGRVEGQLIMLIERGEMVYTIVASSDDELEEASAVMPGHDQSVLDRLRGASRRTIELFGLST